MRTLTQSELRCFRSCARKHHYRYGMLRRPLVSAHALRFGTLWHAGQERWWNALTENPETRMAHAYAGLAGDPVDSVICQALLDGYEAMYGSDAFEVLGVEVPFTMPLINPMTGCPSKTFEIGGKIDAVARQGDRLLIVEHKTSSEDAEAGSLYWERLRLDGQVSIYLNGAKALGFTPDACLYDVVRKPRHKPLLATPAESRKYKKDGTLYAAQRDTDETLEAFGARLREAIAEDPMSFFQRGEVVRIGDEMAEAEYDVWQTARLIREAEIAKRHPRNPDACVLFGRCEYLGVCTGQESIDGPTFRTAETEHEELKAA